MIWCFLKYFVLVAGGFATTVALGIFLGWLLNRYSWFLYLFTGALSLGLVVWFAVLITRGYYN